MRRLFLLRHGITDANVKNVYNPIDDQLCAEGEAGVRKAAKYMAQCTFDAVYCSSLPRAQATAKLLGVAYHVRPLLRDRDFGTMAGQQYLGPCQPTRVLAPGAGTVIGPQFDEQPEDVRVRVHEFLASLGDGDFLIVTHSHVMRWIVRETTGLPMLTEKIENAALWIIEDQKLVHRNWRPWLETTD